MTSPYAAERLALFRPAYVAYRAAIAQDGRRAPRGFDESHLARLAEIARNRVSRRYSVSPKVLAQSLEVHPRTVEKWLSRFQADAAVVAERRKLFRLLCQCVDRARRQPPAMRGRAGLEGYWRAQRMRALAARGVPTKEIARRFKTKPRAVRQILTRKRWP